MLLVLLVLQSASWRRVTGTIVPSSGGHTSRRVAGVLSLRHSTIDSQFNRAPALWHVLAACLHSPFRERLPSPDLTALWDVFVSLLVSCLAFFRSNTSSAPVSVLLSRLGEATTPEVRSSQYLDSGLCFSEPGWPKHQSSGRGTMFQVVVPRHMYSTLFSPRDITRLI